MQPLSGNQRPHLLTAPMKMSLVLRLPRKMHLCRSSSNVQRLPSLLEMLQSPHVLLTFDKVHNPLRLPRESTSERPKVLLPVSFLHFSLRNVLRAKTACTFLTSQLPIVVREWCALYIFTSKCASRSMACTFSTSQLPKVVREWCALCIFTSKCASRSTACTFSTSQLPKVVREWCALYILTWKCASHHNGVHFFISHLASWLRTRRFSEPTFRPSGATNHWKNKVFRNFPTFSRTWIFFLPRPSLL